jgi:ABC-2 type transport system ATP-binding protein
VRAQPPLHSARDFSRYFESPTDVEAVVDLVGLVDKADDRVAQLSGGQKRRLDVGLGLVGDPELLFLDEPTTGLDPAARREMWEMIEGLRDAGKTVLLTTHYMDEADHLADRIIILRHGEIVAQGTSDELRDSLGDVTHIAFRVPADARLDLLGMEAEVSTHLDGALVRIPSKSVQADLGRVLHWADRQALDLADLEVVRPTLDDVFVELAEAPPEEARGQ